MRERAYTKRIMRGVGQGENILKSMEQRRRTTLVATLASRSTRRLCGAAVSSNDNGMQWAGQTFVLIADQRPLLCLEELVPFFLTLLRQKTFWDPRKKIRRSECLLDTSQAGGVILIERVICARVSQWPQIQGYCRGRRQLG